MKSSPIRRRLLMTLLSASVACVAPFAGAQDIQNRTIRLGHLLNKDHPLSKGVQKFAELVAEKSGGKMKVIEFPSSQLGNELQQQAALQGGTQQMMTGATSTLAGIVKEFGILDFPFTFQNEQQADALLDGPFGKALMAKLADHGLIGLGYWENGFRNVTNSRRPIESKDDLNGLKIRMMPNPVYIETFQAFDSNPVPLAFGELFTALETQAVDAQENPYAIILSNKFYEVQDYLSVTNHTYNVFGVTVSKKFWDSLSPTEQKILRDAEHEARLYQRKVSREASNKALAALKEEGMKVNRLTPAALTEMRKLSEPVIKKFSSSYDPELMKLFHSEMERIRNTVKS